MAGTLEKRVTADDVVRRMRRLVAEDRDPPRLTTTAGGALTTGRDTIAGFANPMRAPGDLIRGSASGAAARLAVGDDGDVLTVVAGSPAWAAPEASASGRYRFPVYSTYGGGSLLYTADGHLIYALLELEV